MYLLACRLICISNAQCMAGFRSILFIIFIIFTSVFTTSFRESIDGDIPGALIEPSGLIRCHERPRRAESRVFSRRTFLI